MIAKFAEKLRPSSFKKRVFLLVCRCSFASHWPATLPSAFPKRSRCLPQSSLISLIFRQFFTIRQIERFSVKIVQCIDSILLKKSKKLKCIEESSMFAHPAFGRLEAGQLLKKFEELQELANSMWPFGHFLELALFVFKIDKISYSDFHESNEWSERGECSRRVRRRFEQARCRSVRKSANHKQRPSLSLHLKKGKKISPCLLLAFLIATR